MIKVTNDSENLIIETPESTLAFYQRAGYHKINEPVEEPAPIEQEQPIKAPIEVKEVEKPVEVKPKKAGK